MRSAAAATLLATLAIANPVPGGDKHKTDGYLSVKSMPSCQAVCISENLCYLGDGSLVLGQCSAYDFCHRDEQMLKNWMYKFVYPCAQKLCGDCKKCDKGKSISPETNERRMTN